LQIASPPFAVCFVLLGQLKHASAVAAMASSIAFKQLPDTQILTL